MNVYRSRLETPMDGLSVGLSRLMVPLAIVVVSPLLSFFAADRPPFSPRMDSFNIQVFALRPCQGQVGGQRIVSSSSADC